MVLAIVRENIVYFAFLSQSALPNIFQTNFAQTD